MVPVLNPEPGTWIWFHFGSLKNKKLTVLTLETGY